MRKPRRTGVDGRTVHRLSPALLRTSMDADDLRTWRARLSRLAGALAGVDPGLGLEASRLLNPDMDRFSVAMTGEGLRLRSEVSAQWRAWSVVDSGVLAGEEPRDVGSLRAVVVRWRRDLSLPSVRTWGGMDLSADPMQGRLRSFARLAAALLPEGTHGTASMHPPTARTVGSLLVRDEKTWLLHPDLQADLLRDVPVCAVVDRSDLYEEISFVEQDEYLSCHLPSDVDPMERLRLRAGVASFARPLRRR